MKKENKYILPILTIIVAGLAILSIVVFTLKNRENITKNNREYLLDNTNQAALLVDNSLVQGLTNIQVLSHLISGILKSPELDIASIQYILDDSIFDFIEFSDRKGMNYNTTGGVSYAGDRQYYLDAMQGNSGVELIFNSRATNQTLLVFYSPVYYQDELIGSLMGIYDEAIHLDRLLSMDMFGCHAEVYLCNEDGLIISSNQNIDTTAEISIKTALGPRISKDMQADSFIYEDETAIIPLAGNKTGACIMGLENSDWYLVQIFPEEANEMMIANANRIGILLAVFLVVILVILLILTYPILNKSRLETQKALVKAEAASKAKTEFLFNMSHDIRTPMNAITGFLRLLNQHQEDSVKRREYIRKIGDASEFLLSILNNVLEMSKIEGGKAVLNETVWSAEQMRDSVYSLFATQMQEKKITFEITVDVQHPFVWCDITKIQEIYLNLLSNAYKYTLSGGKVSMRLTELSSHQEKYALFQTEIEDSGIGIAEAFMPHLFEEFSREQNTTHSKIAGTGLGMPIVKRLTELMGGTVAVKSEVGKGTRITIIIPHRIAHEPDIYCDKAEDTALAAFSGKRILLAEDNELNAEIAMELLGEMGLEVAWAQDGDICVDMVEQAETGYYDLILMDIQMPNMNGYQAAEAIRKLDNLAKASIPIVAMTANAFEEDKKNAYAAGMDAHLAKPIDSSKLMETLTEILGETAERASK
ncbi:MAG: response regulator [Oscillospiraceae bacterium]|nr:response regulator [Oscillospiraceae bacterium]